MCHRDAVIVINVCFIMHHAWIPVLLTPPSVGPDNHNNAITVRLLNVEHGLLSDCVMTIEEFR